jgi:hypothetical protein
MNSTTVPRLSRQGVDELPTSASPSAHLAGEPLADLEDRCLERLVAVLLCLGRCDGSGRLVGDRQGGFVARGDLGGFGQEVCPPRFVGIREL